MGIRIDGNTDLINAADGTLTVEGLSINTSGMVTATGGVKVELLLRFIPLVNLI